MNLSKSYPSTLNACILISSLFLAACGDGGGDSSASTNTNTNNSTESTNINTSNESTIASIFPRATGDGGLIVPKLSEECKTPLALELAKISIHADDPIMEINRDLAFQCNRERDAVFAYQESQSTSSRIARRDTAIAPLEGLINFETPHVHPIDITPDGNTLVSVNTAAHKLEVWSISGSSISPLASIPVGIDPVSVRVRNNNEAWVVNHISDSVSIVNLNSQTVIRTLKTDNEPADVVFANGRAFVSASEANAINIFNLSNLNASPSKVSINGEDPRALSVSANGNTVYAAIYESGNGTRLSGNSGGGGAIIRDNQQDDNDVAIINTGNLQVSYRRRLMNMVMAIGINPSTQRVFTVGTEAFNDIPNEPALNGKFIKVNMASFTGSGLSGAIIKDLNPHLDYNSPTVSTSLRNLSLGDPRSITWQQNGQRAFISGMGSNNVIVVDSSGDRVTNFEVGQGPTGIVLKESADIGFVMNKFDGSISIIDLNSLNQISEVKFDDPTPITIKEGRPFIYDTHLTSGTGHTSCASCHVDSRTDRLGWQLSDDNGTSISIPRASNSIPGNVVGTSTISSNKHVMTTQTLIDIMEHPRFHWRGDKAEIDDFNGTFVNLMGRSSQITQTQMNKMKNFLRTLWLPPNPYRRIDNSRPSTVTLPDGTTATSNRVGNNTTNALRGGGNTNNCLACHSGQGNATRNFGANPEIGSNIIAPALPALYDKMGSTFGRTGFGFFHDGGSDLFRAARSREFLAEILTLEGPEGPLVGDEVRQAPHAGVGQQVTISGNGTSTQLNLLTQLINIANNSSWAELIAHVKINGKQRGFVLSQGNNFSADANGETATRNSLLSNAANGDSVTFTLVATGMSTRLALDSDLDGVLNFDEDNDGSDDGSDNDFTASIDGNLSEWTSAQSIGFDGDDINVTGSRADILEAWIAKDSNNLYLAYLNDGPIDSTWWPWQVFIDTDGNASTGYQTNNGLGAEFIVEGSDLMKYVGSGSDWSWNVESSNIGIKNNASAEFSINRQDLDNPSAIQLFLTTNNGPFTGTFNSAGNDLLPNSGVYSFDLNAGNDGGNDNGDDNGNDNNDGISNTLTPNLDGNLDDWSQATSFGPDGNDINITNAQADWLEAWMAHDNDNLYFAYTNDGPINYNTWWPWQTFMDTDDNPETGFKIGNIGADFIIEGADIANYTGTGTNWSWSWTSIDSGKGASQVELRIPRSRLGNINKIKLYMITRNVAFTNDFSAFAEDVYEGTQAILEYNASP